ncbi:MAG: type II toxin-antitoxin system VapB family antitoxin, partial [Angustibacter sp.]
IKDPRADRLAADLAEAHGEPRAMVVSTAMNEGFARSQAQASVGTTGDLRSIIARGRARGTLDSRSTDEILGYDRHGLPQ